MNETIFGKIINGDIPATKVYEDDEFLDINPVAKGHTLLIPKIQYEWIHDAPEHVIAAIFVKAHRLIRAMRTGLGCDYVQLSVVGNEVPHFHVHLIPRFLNEAASLTTRPRTSYATDEEKNIYAEKIKSSI